MIIAFVSLLQSKNSELKKERLQVMAFPAYTIPLDDIQYSNTTPSTLIIQQQHPDPDNVVQAKFDMMIKNIGLGSLVDYEIQEAYYEDTYGEIKDLPLDFPRYFILGKQETIQMSIDVTAHFQSSKVEDQKNMRVLTIIASFNDLLGHQYTQEFTVHSELRSVGHQQIKRTDGTTKNGVAYALNPIKINHRHPIEK